MSTRTDVAALLPPLLRDLGRLALEQGWTIEHTSGGHMRWTPPDGGEPEITSHTVKEKQILKTITHRLMKKGLIVNRSEWRRMKKRRDRIERRRLDCYTPERIKELGLFVIDKEDGTSDAAWAKDAAFLTDEDWVAIGHALAEFSLDHGPGAVFDPALLGDKCYRCGTAFHGNWISKSVHEQTCVGVPTSYDECVADEMADRIAEEVERTGYTSCDHCEAVFYLSELYTHMLEEHDLVYCGDCEIFVHDIEMHDEEIHKAKEPVMTVDSQESDSKKLVDAIFHPNRLPDGATEADMWAALEALVGDIPMNYETFQAVQHWMQATTSLLEIKARYGNHN